MKLFIYLFFVLFFTTLIWGNRIEPRILDITEHQVPIEDLPPKWNGKTIAFISDFQVGMWLGNESTIVEAVEDLIKKNPVAILIGGDFIYHPTDDDLEESNEEWEEDDRERTNMLIDEITNLLKPLIDAKIRTLAVLGNHDYSMDKSSARKIKETASLLKSKLTSLGIEVLENESVKIKIKGQVINLVGVAPFYPRLDNVTKALRGAGDEAKILFMHNANSIKGLGKEKFDLAIAGHTHGGQIRIPGFPKWTWTSLVPHTPDDVMGDGWIKNELDQNLYVNRGIGFSKLPLRFNCRPELSYFTLKSIPTTHRE